MALRMRTEKILLIKTIIMIRGRMKKVEEEMKM